MDHQQALAVRRHMLGLADQAHAADLEPQRQPGAEHLVMVARHIQHARAAGGMAQDQLDHLVMHFVPVPGFAQAPAIDDVADQIEMVGAEGAEEMREEIASAAPRAQMRIGNEHRSIGGPARPGQAMGVKTGRKGVHMPHRHVHGTRMFGDRGKAKHIG